LERDVLAAPYGAVSVTPVPLPPEQGVHITPASGVRTIGVLTGGGDCPGLNPAIRAVVGRASQYGIHSTGIEEGWRGLVERLSRPLDFTDVEEILPLGGTILGTSRTNPLKDEQSMQAVLRNISDLGLDAIVAIGGDDTLSVAAALAERGIKVVGVPKTMDNDIPLTDYTFGFDTAVTISVEAIERLRDTGRSHRRVMVLEVMGRNAGWVALWSGLAGGADWIAIPEVPLDLDELCDHLKALHERGKRYAVVVASESVDIPGLAGDGAGKDEFGHEELKKRGVGPFLADTIEERTGFETRATVIGHVQRGGSPTVFDRILATRMGVAAMDLVSKGIFGKMVALQQNEIVAVDLQAIAGKQKLVPRELYDISRTFFR